MKKNKSLDLTCAVHVFVFMYEKYFILIFRFEFVRYRDTFDYVRHEYWLVSQQGKIY